MDNRDSTIRHLCKENEMLSEEVQQLKKLLTPVFFPPMEWNLTRMNRDFFSILLSADIITNERFFIRICGVYGNNNVSVSGFVARHICNLRQKLEPFGVCIKNIRGVGYSLEDRRRWKAELCNDQG